MIPTQLLCSFLLLANAGSTAETTIAVFPKEQFEKSKLAKPIAEALASKLQRPGWKVIDGTATEGRKSFLKPVEAVIEGRDAKLAMSLDADIYIVFEGQTTRSKSGKAFAFGLGAYETVTGRKMASETIISKTGRDDHLALAKDVCDQIVPAVVKQMQDYQEVDAQKGDRYLVALYNPPKNIDMALAVALKKTCRHVKSYRRDDQQRFYVQCNSPRKEIIGVIKKAIRKKFRRKKYIIYPSPRQLVVIDFK